MTVAETKVSPERQFVQGICRTAARVTLDLTGVVKPRAWYLRLVVAEHLRKYIGDSRQHGRRS
jgi:hypothetical protein